MALLHWIPIEERILFPWYSAAFFVLIAYGSSALISAFHPSRARTVLTLVFITAFTYLQRISYLDMPFWAVAGLYVNWPHNAIVCVERFIYGVQEDEAWRRVKGRPRAEVEKRRTPQTFWKRLVWGAEIACNPRGVGWSYEQKNLPQGPAPSMSRSSYLVRKLSYMCWLTFLKQQVDIVAAHLLAEGRYLDDGLGPVTATFYTLPMWQRVLGIWLNILNSYYAISVTGSLITVAGVAVGAYQPEECPPINGPLWELYTVRKAWGSVWHQHMRPAVAFVGNYIAHDLFGLKKGTFGSKYVQLFVGFETSALIHIYAEYLTLGHGLGDLSFFGAQAAAIFVEDHVISLAQSLGAKPNALWRFVGFLWVVAWLSASLQSWTGRQLEQGVLLNETPFDPFGLDDWLRHHQIFDYQTR